MNYELKRGYLRESITKTDEIRLEQRQAYLHRIGLEVKNWMIHSGYLLEKGEIESDKIKTFDRGLLQIQSLIDQFTDADPAPAERLRFIYSIYYPPIHLLKKRLARKYLQYGLPASARDIFIELHMYEELIRSYIILQDTHKAKELTLARLDVSPNPELWCLLGKSITLILLSFLIPSFPSLFSSLSSLFPPLSLSRHLPLF